MVKNTVVAAAGHVYFYHHFKATLCFLAVFFDDLSITTQTSKTDFLTLWSRPLLIIEFGKVCVQTIFFTL